MNILIFDGEKLKVAINLSHCIHIEFVTHAAVINFDQSYELWNDCPRLFVVGNSRQKLENGLIDNLPQVRIQESDLLTDIEFQQWNARRGWLQQAELVDVA